MLSHGQPNDPESRVLGYPYQLLGSRPFSDAKDVLYVLYVCLSCVAG